MTVTALPHWYTIPDLAQRAGVSEWTIRKEAKAGRLRVRRIGRCARVLDEDAATWMRGTHTEASEQ